MKGTILSLGASDFPTLRSADMIYVDKTALIYKLASTPKGKFFLSRPRRFGKSLLVTTFESLFMHGLKYFEGLAISRLWTDKTYKVAHLDFSELDDFSTVEEFRTLFYALLARQFAKVGFHYDPLSYDSALGQLSSWLQDQEPSSLVLLIDEYDSPLTLCLNKTELFEQIRRVLSSFYKVVKSCDRAWRFVFITGIAKFAKMSIFSGLNNLKDISLLTKYGSLLGYTEAELNQYFEPYLDNAAKAVGLSQQDLMATMKRQYDGFCFEESGQINVYSPWSVLSFLSEPEAGIKNYWYESGGQPTLLVEYMKTHFFSDPINFELDKRIAERQLSLSADTSALSDLPLLTQTGYLTIKRAEGSSFYLGYPNEEVRLSIAQLYADRLLQKNCNLIPDSDKFKRVVSSGPAESIVSEFNRLILGVDYMFAKDASEVQITALFGICFVIAGFDPKIEHCNAFGRSDLEVSLGERYLVIEFKVKRDDQTVENALEEAVTQTIDRKYGLPHSDMDLMRIALVYVRPKDKVETDSGIFHWRVVPSPKHR